MSDILFHNTLITVKPDINSWSYQCPLCEVNCLQKNWIIPNMRLLLELECPKCHQEYLADLPIGHAVYYPMMMRKSDSKIFNYTNSGQWFMRHLKNTYADPSDQSINIETKLEADSKSCIIFNTLDINYGHSLLKLMNLNNINEDIEDDILVIVQNNLKWLIAEKDYNQIIVDPESGHQQLWSDKLTDTVKNATKIYNNIRFSNVNPYNSVTVDYIEDLISIKSFELRNWSNKDPTITYIWRGCSDYSGIERLWCSQPTHSGIISKTKGAVNHTASILGDNRIALEEQKNNIIKLWKELDDSFNTLDFAVTGLDNYGKFPHQIKDLRATAPNPEMEKKWCNRYSQSHLVIGVHGSGMILPSAFSGGVVELIPEWKWGNLADDYILSDMNNYISLQLYKTLPTDIDISTLSDIITSTISYFPNRQLKLGEDVDKIENKLEIVERERETSDYSNKVVSNQKDIIYYLWDLLNQDN